MAENSAENRPMLDQVEIGRIDTKSIRAGVRTNVPRNELWGGVPAYFKRIMQPDERSGFDHSSRARTGLRPN